MSGRLRSTLRVVVKPLTSSPAMPMTTLGASRPAMPLGLVERRPAVGHHGRDVGHGARLHVREALALPAHPGDHGTGVPAGSRRRGPWRTRCRCRAPAGHCSGLTEGPRRTSRRSRSTPDALALSQPGAHAASRWPRRAPVASGHRPWAISGRPPPLPPLSVTTSRTRVAASTPWATRSSLTVTKSCAPLGLVEAGHDDAAAAESRAPRGPRP